MIRSFLLGAVTGAVIAVVWRDEILAFLRHQTRDVRTRAADRLQAVEETTDQLLDRAARPLQRAEAMLEGAKAKIGANLRAGQDAIRPESPQDERG
jgi:hypothetical protein